MSLLVILCIIVYVTNKAHLSLIFVVVVNIRYYFFLFCYLERLCLHNREICLQNSKTNMTKNRDKIVTFQKINI